MLLVDNIVDEVTGSWSVMARPTGAAAASRIPRQTHIPTLAGFSPSVGHVRFPEASLSGRSVNKREFNYKFVIVWKTDT